MSALVKSRHRFPIDVRLYCPPKLGSDTRDRRRVPLNLSAPPIWAHKGASLD
jgi:hypothetical protein